MSHKNYIFTMVISLLALTALFGPVAYYHRPLMATFYFHKLKCAGQRYTESGCEVSLQARTADEEAERALTKLVSLEPYSVPLLIKGLSDPIERVRYKSAEGLWRMESYPPELKQRLTAILNEG